MVTFDDTYSLASKAQWAKENGMAGQSESLPEQATSLTLVSSQEFLLGPSIRFVVLAWSSLLPNSPPSVRMINTSSWTLLGLLSEDDSERLDSLETRDEI